MMERLHLIKSIRISIYGDSFWLSLIQMDPFVYLLSPMMQGLPLGSSQEAVQPSNLGGGARFKILVGVWEYVAAFDDFEK